MCICYLFAFCYDLYDDIICYHLALCDIFKILNEIFLFYISKLTISMQTMNASFHRTYRSIERKKEWNHVCVITNHPMVKWPFKCLFKANRTIIKIIGEKKTTTQLASNQLTRWLWTKHRYMILIYLFISYIWNFKRLISFGLFIWTNIIHWVNQ